MAFGFLQWLSAFFNSFPLSPMAFRISPTAFQFSSMTFCFPRKSIYGEKYTKDCYSSFVFFATRSPSFVITNKQYLRDYPTPSPTNASDVNSKIVTLLQTSDSVTASHDMSSNNSIIVKGTWEKKRILMAYQEKFGSKYPELIVTRKKGKISDNTSLHCTCMRPSLNKWYRVADLHLYNIITTIIKECRVSFLKEDISNLCLVNKDFANIVPKVLHWLRVDFTPLRDPHLGYEQQDHINPYCVEMASADIIHFGLDPGKVVRFLLGKYRPILRCLSHPRCNSRSRHIRRLQSYQMNIA
jgi:hypothetical protein